MGLLNQVEEKAEELNKYKKSIINKISRECSKYKNTNIKYISNKIFTINSKYLINSWSPTYYDFSHQFKCILYIFSHTNPDNLINKYEQIKSKGIACFLPNIVKEYKLDNPITTFTKQLEKDWYRTSYTVIKLHPEVIKFLDSILIN